MGGISPVVAWKAHLRPVPGTTVAFVKGLEKDSSSTLEPKFKQAIPLQCFEKEALNDSVDLEHIKGFSLSCAA
jgi:hypothetical protein